MSKIPYMTERIVNFRELKNIIEGCYIMAQFLQKESPHKESFEPLIEDLKKARDFQFEIEVKKINYIDETSCEEESREQGKQKDAETACNNMDNAYFEHIMNTGNSDEHTKYDEGICAKCVHKDCFDCGVDCDQEYAEERFAGEGWDRELIMKYACRMSMAKETGKCKFYSEDPATVVVCAECKHCILGEKGPMSMMTGNCLIDKVGTFDEYMGCPHGERK